MIPKKQDISIQGNIVRNSGNIALKPLLNEPEMNSIFTSFTTAIGEEKNIRTFFQ